MNRIKELRENAGMTQQELADKLDSAKSTIAMYESGNRKPSLNILMKLSEIFHCSTDYLLEKTNIKEHSNKIGDLYMHLAKEAQELNLDEQDVNYIIQFYKKNKK